MKLKFFPCKTDFPKDIENFIFFNTLFLHAKFLELRLDLDIFFFGTATMLNIIIFFDLNIKIYCLNN